MVSFPPLDSYATALVLLPPLDVQRHINEVRSGNDKAFPRWTAHATLLFPFVAPDKIETAASILKEVTNSGSFRPFPISLDHVDAFPKRGYSSVHLAPKKNPALRALHTTLSQAANYTGRSFIPHVTIGQAATGKHKPRNLVAKDDVDPDEETFLRGAGALLLSQAGGSISWEVDSLAILSKDERDGGKMKLVATIHLGEGASSPEAEVAPNAAITHCLKDHQNDSTLLQPPISVVTYNILSSPVFPPNLRIEDIKRVALSKPVASILCLQEVPTEFLSAFLSDPDIVAAYSYSSRSPSSVLPNLRNTIVLSTVPFSWADLSLGWRTNTVVCTFGLSVTPSRSISESGVEKRTLILAATHLPAGHTSAARARRTSYLSKIYNHLQTHHADAEWIIAGDLNLDDGAEEQYGWQTTSWTDAWRVHIVHSNTSGELALGYTFYPAHNELASKTSRAPGSPPFRYDRILIRSDGGLSVRSASVDRCTGSDHWPLRAELEFNDRIQTHGQVAKPPTAGIDPLSSLHLEAFIKDAGAVPSTQADKMRLKAITSLKRLLLVNDSMVDVEHSESFQVHDPTAPVFRVEVVGSRALGVDTSTSDIDVLVVGSLAPNAFLPFVWQQVASFGPDVNLIRIVRNARVPTLEMRICGEKLDVQYICAPSILSNWDVAVQVPAVAAVPAVSATIQRSLASYRDAKVLSNFITSAFQIAHRALGIFLRKRGLYGARFGYIGGGTLAVMLAHIAGQSGNVESTSAAELVRRFIGDYSGFSWESEVVEIPLPNLSTALSGQEGIDVPQMPLYSRNAREPLVVLSPTRPRVNMCSAASPASVSALRAELDRAHSMLRSGNRWDDICTPAIGAFLHAVSFVRIDLNWWDGGSGPKLRGWVEARLVHLVIDLHKQYAHTSPRLWPGAFVPANTEGGEATYLIALSGQLPVTTHALKTFEATVAREAQRGTIGACDPDNTYIGVSTIFLEQVRDLVLSRQWDDEDELTNADLLGELSVEEVDEANVAEPINIEQDNPITPVTGKQSGKLRTSADVYNRLMWDASLSQGPGSAGYSIGYEDRFVGVKEVPLTAWKREVEDEAFIPFHRVVHFRRISDGVLVWDRRARVDRLFQHQD